MSGDETRREELAGSILDGTPVDWDALDSDAPLPDRPFLRQLKASAAIADVQRAEVADTWGPLRLLGRVGQGAFGDVYRAWDPRLDREVALKLMPASPSAAGALETSIIEEGRLLARVRHPNIVTIYGAERIEDRVGLWMEFVDGRTIHQLVADDGRRFSPREAAALGETLCGAVEAVHAAGLLHRDIKAQNVMVAADGRVALMDFGAGGELRAAVTEALAGTPLYLAPEVLGEIHSGTEFPTVRSDVYSIGVLLFFLLTGTYPVLPRDLDGLRAAHARGDRRSLRELRPDVPGSLARVVDRAIDPDPARRYPTAASLGAALDGIRSTRRRALAGALVMAALALAFLAFRPSTPAPAAAAETRPQIAVLPLTNLTRDTSDEYLADGLTDELIRSLGTVRGLDVRSRTSSFAFKGRKTAISEVGRQLGVGYVLDGSVARAGGRLRVNAQLLRVAGEVPLWSERFERELTVPDIHRIQDDISRSIVDELRLTFNRGQRVSDTSLGTYELYLKARWLAERQGETGPFQAVKLFEQVIALDPRYARAHAGMVLAYAYLSMMPYQAVPYEKAHPRMRAAAMEAARLDPSLADAHAAQGWVYAREFRWAEAERAFRRAIDLDPALTFSYTSFSLSTLQPLNRLAEAEELLRGAWRRDPLNNDVPRALARVVAQANRPAEVLALLEPLIRDASDLPKIDSLLGRALVSEGRAEEALPLLERRRERVIDPKTGMHPWVAFAYIALGRRADAERLARQDDRLPFRRAIINAALGNADRMFDGLQEMADTEPQRLVVLLRAADLAPYRNDERFKRLLRRVNLEP